MRAEAYLKWLAMAFISGCVTILCMTFFCILYYNVPVHYPNPSGATDHNWTPNAFYAQCREGISYGKTNNEGFYNIFDYEEGMNIDVLIMGSSHMEGANVLLSDTTASQLNTLMQRNVVYNIGISGHSFPICCSNFTDAVNTYQPTKYVVIETSKLNFADEELGSVLDETMPELADHSGGILGFLSKNMFLRLIYSQLKGLLGRSAVKKKDSGLNEVSQSKVSRELLGDVLSMISQTASEHGVCVIIFYHPTTSIDADGSLLLPDDAENRQIFSSLCEQNDITFLDMTERFEYEYATNHILPHGFCNSSVGSGHLNKYGHEMIAEELYNIIERGEE